MTSKTNPNLNVQQFTVIDSTENPLNCFRNQIILEEAFIHLTEKSTLLETLKPIVNPKVVSAIHCNLPTLASIQHAL